MAPASPGSTSAVSDAVVAPLPPRTASLVRSGVVLPSLPSVLSELVQNSIDAGARTVHCHIDLDTWTIRCEDSGHGIPHSDLAQLAASSPAAGRRPLSSKYTLSSHDESSATYGYRGESLISISDLATLDIQTRPIARSDSTAHPTWHLILRGGKCLAFEEAHGERIGPGTTVIVRDIFHKLPVRRRSLSKPAAQAALLNSLRSTVTSLALVHPLTVFSLTDTTTSLSAITCEPRTLLRVGRCSSESLVGRWRQLWGRAGVERVWEFDEVESSQGEESRPVRAKGFFSLSAAHSKAGQYVFVNTRPLAPATSVLHKQLNALFAASSFARFASSHLATPSGSPVRKAAAKSPRRPAERHPTFVLALEVPGRVVDVGLAPDKRSVEFEDPARIERFVEALAKRFLTLHGFLNAASAPPTPPKVPAAPTTRSADFARGKRIHREEPQKTDTKGETAADLQPLRRTHVEAQPPVVHPILDGPSIDGDSDGSDSGPQRWLDPRTGDMWCVDRRTGNSWRPELVGHGTQESCHGCGEQRRAHRSKVDRSVLKRKRGFAEETEDEGMPDWLRTSLENWKNPVFPAAPRAQDIPKLRSSHSGTSGTLPHLLRSAKRPATGLTAKVKAEGPTRSAQATAEAFFRTAYPPPGLELADVERPPTLTELPLPASGKAPPPPITREQLAQASFVAQVDNKYLLVRVPAMTGTKMASNEDSDSAGCKAILLLVDQHAASERVRVERLYDAVVGEVARGRVPATTSARIGLVLSGREYCVVRDRWRGEFSRWGIEVDLEPGIGVEVNEAGNTSDYRQVVLTAVPAAVALRVTSPREPRLAQDLVRAFLTQLDDSGPAPATASAGSGGIGWVAMLRHCPRVLKDLLDSKACRGAIMFNDVLTPAQAATLLEQLTHTLFPGQCAHGRPSMVPVVRFSPQAARATRQQVEQVDWSRFNDPGPRPCT